MTSDTSSLVTFALGALFTIAGFPLGYQLGRGSWRSGAVFIALAAMWWIGWRLFAVLTKGDGEAAKGIATFGVLLAIATFALGLLSGLVVFGRRK